ncbi:hypothetical protein Golob_020947, partial [Gossypium lobatum]|nr:hypothetical protein [Gossypium lobatum]
QRVGVGLGSFRYESLRDVTRAIKRLNGFRLYGHRIAISMAKFGVRSSFWRKV